MPVCRERDAWGPEKKINHHPTNESEEIMFNRIAIILIFLWLLGLVTHHTLGGVVHIVLVVALVMILINFIQQRKLS